MSVTGDVTVPVGFQETLKLAARACFYIKSQYGSVSVIHYLTRLISVQY